MRSIRRFIRPAPIAATAMALLAAPSTARAAPQPPAASSGEAAQLERIAAFEKGGEPSDPAYIDALGALSLLYVNQARYAEALPYLRRALAASERIHGPRHPLTDEVRTTLLVAEAFVNRR